MTTNNQQFDTWWKANKQAFLEGSTAEACARIAFEAGVKQAPPTVIVNNYISDSAADE